MTRLIITLVIIMVAFSFNTVSAQQNTAPTFNFSSSETDVASKKINETLNPQTNQKSLGLAYALSFANSAIPLGLGYYLFNDVSEPLGVLLMSYGAIVGPSAGSYYARDFQTANTPLVIRGIVVGMYVTSQFSGTNQVNKGPEVILYSAIAAFVGTSIYNVIKIPDSVRTYNRRNRFQGSFDMGPSVDINTGTPVLRASMSF